MAKKIIRTGTTADPTGDSLKNAFIKVNDNFTELYNALGLDEAPLNLGAFEFTGSVMTTTDSSAITIDQAVTVTSDLTVGGDIVPSIANGSNLGSIAKPWRSLYVSNNTIYIGGTAVGIDTNGSLTTGGTVVGSTPAWDNITGKPTLFSGSYNDLTNKPSVPTLVSQLTNDSGFLTSVSNIQSESDVSIRINLTDSTTRIWRFGEDGALTFPDGTNQTTAYQKVAVPANSYGAAGDVAGMVAFSSGYNYYCTASYSTSNGIASVTISTPLSRNDSLHWDTETTVIQFATPSGGVAATGTPVFDGSGDLTGITIDTAGSGYLKVVDGGPANVTDIFIIQTGGTGGNSTREIRNGVPAGVSITLTTTHIWKRVALDATSW